MLVMGRTDGMCGTDGVFLETCVKPAGLFCLHSTCTDAREGLNDHPLVLEGAGGRLQDGQKDLPEKHLETERQDRGK